MPKSKPNAAPAPDTIVDGAGPKLWVNLYQSDLDSIIYLVSEKTSITGEKGWLAALDLLRRLRSPIVEPPFMSQTVAPAVETPEPDGGEKSPTPPM